MRFYTWQRNRPQTTPNARCYASSCLTGKAKKQQSEFRLCPNHRIELSGEKLTNRKESVKGYFFGSKVYAPNEQKLGLMGLCR
jgi:hypothetical protein